MTLEEALASMQNSVRQIADNATAIANAHDGLRAAVWFLSMAVAKQPGIDPRMLADTFSEIVNLHSEPEDEIPMPVLDIRAALYQIAEESR